MDKKIKIPSLQNFQDRLEALKKKNNLKSTSNLQFRLTKPTEDGASEEAIIRILPYLHHSDSELTDPFIEVYMHYGIGKFGTVACPEKNFNEPCAICNHVRHIYKMSDKIAKENGVDSKNVEAMLANPEIKLLWNLAKDLRAKKRVYMPIIVRGKETEDPKFYAMSDNFFNSFLTAVTKKIARNAAKSPIDPYSGVDVALTLTNDGKMYGTTTFEILSDEDPTPAIEGSVEEINAIISKIPNIWGTLLEKKTSDEVQKIATELEDEDGMLDISRNEKEKEETISVPKKTVTPTASVEKSASETVIEGLNSIDDLDEDDI